MRTARSSPSPGRRRPSRWWSRCRTRACSRPRNGREALGAEIREAVAAGGCRDGSDYYERWCEALEHLLIDKGLASHDGVDALAASWVRAAEATPHGKPILLANDPLAG